MPRSGSGIDHVTSPSETETYMEIKKQKLFLLRFRLLSEFMSVGCFNVFFFQMRKEEKINIYTTLPFKSTTTKRPQFLRFEKIIILHYAVHIFIGVAVVLCYDEPL